MKKGEEIVVDVTALNSEGKGIAKLEDGFVIFTEKVLPGDKALVKIRKKKSSYAEARLIQLLEPSRYRIDPPCEYFGVCGGCKIQNLEYPEQLKFKTESVKNALERIGGFRDYIIPAAIGSKEIFFYRNKMEFSFSDDRWVEFKSSPQLDLEIGKEERKELIEDESIKEAIKYETLEPLNEENGEAAESPTKPKDFALGLHVPRFHSKIIDIHRCYLQSEISNGILNYTRDFFKTRGLSIYSTTTHSGYLRFLIIRQCSFTKDLMVNLMTYDYNEPLISEYQKGLLDLFPQITTFLNGITAKKAQVAFGESEQLLFGPGYITEKLTTAEGKEFSYKISPNSFFQTNSTQAEVLYNITADYGEFNKNDNVLDLYCGAGSIGIFISDKVNKVLGVELIEDAINNANENKKLNDINNIEFLLSDIKDFIESTNIKEYNKIVLDPPRSGLHPDICEILSNTDMERIVYVSCNPSTQARDLAIICSKGKYEIDKIQPVDMFPHTYHVENVISLKRI